MLYLLFTNILIIGRFVFFNGFLSRNGKDLELFCYKSKRLVMKDSMKFFARIGMLCIALSITGGLYAHTYSFHAQPPKKHRYYYYPRQNVYYDPVESVYFVWERTYWKPVPHYYWAGSYSAFVYSDSPRIELWIATDHPYYYNVEHRSTYAVYRDPEPAQARIRVDARPKPNVSFHLEINSAPKPRPVYVERQVVIVKEHDRGYHKGHGRGHGHGHHPGRGKGHGHH